VARRRATHEREPRQARANDELFRRYLGHYPASHAASTADELTKLAGLRDAGVLTPEEFEAQKAKLLG
jgi:hypothetical protein